MRKQHVKPYPSKSDHPPAMPEGIESGGEGGILGMRNQSHDSIMSCTPVYSQVREGKLRSEPIPRPAWEGPSVFSAGLAGALWLLVPEGLSKGNGIVIKMYLYRFPPFVHLFITLLLLCVEYKSLLMTIYCLLMSLVHQTPEPLCPPRKPGWGMKEDNKGNKMKLYNSTM